MKIFITSYGDSPDSKIDHRFGRCSWYIVYDAEKDSYEAKVNPFHSGHTPAGMLIVKKIIGEGVKVVISGGMGPKAFASLHSANIRVFAATNKRTVREAVRGLLNGELPEVLPPEGGLEEYNHISKN